LGCAERADARSSWQLVMGPGQTRYSVLLLEDNFLDAELVQARLAASDFTFDVVVVTGKDPFIEAFETQPFDLILADYSLPDFDGLSALARVRSKYRRLPFIMVSGAQGEEIAVEALLNGSTDYVLKQRLDRLVPAVKRALAEHADYLLREAAERERDLLAGRFNQMLAGTSDAIVMVDRDWNMIFANSKAHEVYSYGGNIVGRNLWEAFPDARYEGSPYVEHYYRAMDDNTAGEFEAYYPAPLEAWLHIMVYPADYGIVTFSRDITERKRSQAALIQTEKLAAVGRLASSIAHEINNPLESMTNLLYLALRSKTLEESHGFLLIAERELRRVSAITSQTLRFHRQSSNPTPLNPAEAIRESLTVQHGRIVNGAIEIMECFRPSRPVFCFEGEVRQVLNNLIGNALDALRAVGGRLFLRSREGTHWPSGEPGIIITVADSAGGMSGKTLKRIFEPFFTTKGEAGTGLGLWVSSEIVARHRGSLTVRSRQEPGAHGTVFRLFLPFTAAERTSQFAGDSLV
jgi:PAS domain S-box-containing protein